MKGLEVNSCRMRSQKQRMKVTREGSKADKHTCSQTRRMWAYLQPNYVNQRLVGDVDVAQYLGDWHAGD